MDARARTVSEILHESAQYIVPLFQRSYSWHKEHWQRLHADILAVADAPEPRMHFLGPLVCTIGRVIPGEGALPAYQLIDGQQRLTTLTVVLASIRDVARMRGVDDLAEEVTEDYLIHKRKQGLQRLRVIPRLGDREALGALVEGQDLGPCAHLRIVQAWKFFRRQVLHRVRRSPAAELRHLFNVVTQQLSLVMVTIDQENPYEIFESLNATGLPLAESDLIRNFVFMQVPVPEQGAFDRLHWQPLENLFAPWGDASSAVMTGFYRDYLMRDGRYSREKSTFVDFKSQQKARGLTAEQQTAELVHFAALAVQIRRPEGCASARVAQCLSDIELMDIGTAYALVLNLLDRHSSKRLPEDELVICLRDLVSFVLRRTVCGESTRAYGQWFVEAIGLLGDAPTANLQRYWLKRGWPDDAAFTRALEGFQLYSREPRKTKMILQALERAEGHKEPVDLGLLTIEHVMPQCISGDEAGQLWQEALGGNWEEHHERCLHVLGNLTLTGYNPELGKMSFAAKQELYRDSHVGLNRHFAGLTTWNADAVKVRTSVLANVLCRIWSRPSSSEPYVGELDEVPVQNEASPARRRNVTYWTAFLKKWDKSLGLEPPKPSESGEMSIVLSPDCGASITLWQFRRERKVVTYVRFKGSRGRSLFHRLQERAQEIDDQIEGDLIWNWPLQQAFAVCEEDADFADPGDWEIQHAWFHGALKEIVEALRSELDRDDEEGEDGIGDSDEQNSLRKEFWTQLLLHAAAITELHANRKASIYNWVGGGIGRSGFSLNYSVREFESQVEVYIDFGRNCEDRNERAFRALQKERAAVEAEFGAALDWQELPGRRARRICKIVAGGWRTPMECWPETHAALVDAMVRLDRALRTRVQQLELGA